jgi:hypothetical protein
MDTSNALTYQRADISICTIEKQYARGSSPCSINPLEARERGTMKPEARTVSLLTSRSHINDKAQPRRASGVG